MTAQIGMPTSHARTPAPRPLRIGDKVRSLVDDVNVHEGLVGLVVNTAPPLYGQPALARVLWDNDTVSIAAASTFEIIREMS